MKLKLQQPLDFVRLNQAFGLNENPLYKKLGLKGHNGWDYYAPDGTKVKAAHDGEVTFSGEDNSGGLGIVIRTLEKFDYEDKQVYFKTIYWHLQKDSFQVKAGEKVKAGQWIANADNTGASTGSHLHFGLKPLVKGEADWDWSNLEQDNGYGGAIDPQPYFPTPPLFIKEMSQGERSGEVVKLQLFLKKLGFFTYPEITGFYGTQTSAAVLRFQLKYCQLSWFEKVVLGGKKCGPKTLAALNLVNESN